MQKWIVTRAAHLNQWNLWRSWLVKSPLVQWTYSSAMTKLSHRISAIVWFYLPAILNISGNLGSTKQNNVFQSIVILISWSTTHHQPTYAQASPSAFAPNALALKQDVKVGDSNRETDPAITVPPVLPMGVDGQGQHSSDSLPASCIRRPCNSTDLTPSPIIVVLITCHQVAFYLWWLYEWVISKMAFFPQPYLAPVNSTLCLPLE